MALKEGKSEGDCTLLQKSSLKLKRTWCFGLCAIVVVVSLLYFLHPVVRRSLQPPKEIYIITRSYGGQMTRAIRNLMGQQCWAADAFGQDVKVFIVEPFSTDSELVHTPKIWSELVEGHLHTASRFGNYYDLDHYNHLSVIDRSTELVPWEDFINRAPRKAISVTVPMYACLKRTRSKQDCFYSKTFNAFLDSLTEKGFDTIYSVCLDCSNIDLPFKFKELLSKHLDETGSISLFINTWRNYAFTCSWLQLPNDCKLAEDPTKSSKRLIPSYSVRKHSRVYIEKYTQKGIGIAVMLRIERFLTLVLSDHSKISVQACLEEVLSIHDKIRSKKKLGTFVTVDIGQYGSKKMQEDNQYFLRNTVNSIGNITAAVESVFKHIYNGSLTLSNWEKTFTESTGGITERGYIAMLQQSLASQSDCLILMGGGSFQQVAGYQYLSAHSHQPLCIYTVCVSDNFKQLFALN